MRRWVSFSAAVLVAVGFTMAAALAAACAPGRDKGEAALAVDGQVRLTSSSRSSVVDADGATVRPGHTVKVLSGSAQLSFGGGRRMELRRGTTVKVEEIPVVLNGDALLIADGAPFRVDAAGTSFAMTRGVTRVTRALGLEAASYRGRVRISSAGQRMTVHALRRATIAALGVLPDRVEPLRLRATDAWDRRYLGEAMEWSDHLQAASDGMTAQVDDGVARDAGFFTNLLPDLGAEPLFDSALVDSARAPGETLVGAAITLGSRGGSFAQRWRDVFGFRDDGAAWGLVAMDQRLADAGRLSDRLDVAFGRAESFTVQAVAAANEELASSPGTPEEPAPPAADTADTAAPVRPARPTSPTTTPPAPAEQPPLLQIDIVPAAPEGERRPIQNTLDTVEGLVSGLLSSLQ